MAASWRRGAGECGNHMEKTWHGAWPTTTDGMGGGGWMGEWVGWMEQHSPRPPRVSDSDVALIRAASALATRAIVCARGPATGLSLLRIHRPRATSLPVSAPGHITAHAATPPAQPLTDYIAVRARAGYFLPELRPSTPGV
jgi:hypothetical protein